MTFAIPDALGRRIQIPEDCAEDEPYFTLGDDAAIRAYYKENGYVVIRGLVPPELCDEVRRQFDTEGRGYGGPLYRFTQPALERNRWNAEGFLGNPILNVQSLPPGLRSFRRAALAILSHDRVASAAKAILGEKPKLVQSMFFEGNTNTRPHQDSYFLDAEVIGGLTAGWFALEDIGPGAGRLYVYPGSNKIDLPKNQGHFNIAQHHDRYLEATRQMIRDRELICVAPALAKGDVLFWNSKTIHGSLETMTPERSRCSFTAHYIPETSRFLQFQTRPVRLNIETVNGMQVHKPKDMSRVSTRAIMWLETSHPQIYRAIRKLLIRAVTR